ncbi:MAG: DNA mismatch repair protein MutS [Puniceicoccales bacterium]|jgi:DNA mismatch repair protein MutS|nr:DNA mismatch repair protein MutS [Puniceicoccales bacterium]
MAASDPKTTPLMKQYYGVRDKLPPDVVLLFRVGDFYEMFGRDAEVGAKALTITLTRRAGMPLAGVPFQALNTYVPRLLAAGLRVAICEQVERGKDKFDRVLSRILTPGTIVEDAHLEARHNNYLLAVAAGRAGTVLAAWLELSTAEFKIAAGTPETVLPVLAALNASEVLVPDADASDRALEKMPAVAAFLDTRLVTRRPEWEFAADTGARAVAAALGVLNLQGFGIEPGAPALGAAGAVLAYATETLCARPANLYQIAEHKQGGALVIDAASQRNLELFRGSDGRRDSSLFAALDGTVTGAGGRLLEQWLAAPPADAAVSRARQNITGDLVRHSGLRARLQEHLAQTHDVTRILSRLQNRIRNPRDLGGIRDTLAQLPVLCGELEDAALEGTAVAALAARLDPNDELRELLARALNSTIPNDIRAGGVVRDGYDAELDRLRRLKDGHQAWLQEFERTEQQRTGIKNLRVIYNGAFGYLIEVSKGNVPLVPANYERRQTLTGYERYTTTELRAKERELLNADEYAIAREVEVFNQIIEEIRGRSQPLLATAAALAELDIHCGWAATAREWDYCRPEVDDSDALEIEQGRHPVVERMLRAAGGGQSFVPNDARLSGSGEQVALLTGPNMAGKSTYIRQVALIALMAQLGSWVPAKRARIGVADRLFCRVGASDELTRGNSTFMVEMNEAANILNNATANSLVILDEIGRGTSTYDGISIAWAVVEYLHGSGERGPRTLFATHYHELTRLAETLPRLRNYCVVVKEWNDEIIFVRQVVPGAADRSYGIHVARLAGMPAAVVARANEILADMEGGSAAFMKSAHMEKTFAATRQNTTGGGNEGNGTTTVGEEGTAAEAGEAVAEASAGGEEDVAVAALPPVAPVDSEPPEQPAVPAPAPPPPPAPVPPPPKPPKAPRSAPLRPPPPPPDDGQLELGLF